MRKFGLTRALVIAFLVFASSTRKIIEPVKWRSASGTGDVYGRSGSLLATVAASTSYPLNPPVETKSIVSTTLSGFGFRNLVLKMRMVAPYCTGGRRK